MNRPMNVMKTDTEQSCFCCPATTRLVLIEATQNFPICESCLFQISAIELIVDKMEGVKQTVN